MSETSCPRCRNPIDDEDALLCHFCGVSLNRTSASLLGKIRGAGGKWVWIVIVAIVAAAMLASMF